jgi:hypothetical protein
MAMILGSSMAMKQLTRQGWSKKSCLRVGDDFLTLGTKEYKFIRVDEFQSIVWEEGLEPKTGIDHCWGF